MKIFLKLWLFGALGAIVITHSSSQYLTQRVHHDSEEAVHTPSDTRYFRLRSYEPESHNEAQLNDPRHYQSLEQYHQPTSGHHSAYQTQHHSSPQQPLYYQPEDTSYHRAQEISHHEPRNQYQQASPQYEEQNQGSYHEPRQQYQQVAPQYEEQNHGSYHEPRQQYQQSAPRHEEQNHGSYSEPEVRETPNYGSEDSENYQEPSRPRSSHPTPLKTDPKLPLFFTMYEKRVIRDPLAKYGKGPWRYLTYGHGITYGSKEPGKVFEKGYGYIRALGRDHCKEAEHLCPPTDDSKPFEYEGRKEPYFGYRPH